MTIRLSKPNLEIEQQIHQAGIGLINIFGEDLFRFIDNELNISRGTRWLLDIQKSDFRYQSGNFKDPSVLLKDIIRNSSSPFREPLRKIAPQKGYAIDRAVKVTASTNQLFGHMRKIVSMSGNTTSDRQRIKDRFLAAIIGIHQSLVLIVKGRRLIE